jgi:hypothetical protein
MSSDRTVTATFATDTPPAGSYSGNSQPGNQALSFYVSSDGSHVQDVYANTSPTCSPSKVFGAGQLHFASIAINADGSFSAATTEAGVAFNTPAQFTYTFIGHFHGQAANGTERAAGQLREDVTFNDGTAYTCTTNTLTWAATRDTQGDQTALAPPPGSYSGNSQLGNQALSFSVSSSGIQLQNVTANTSPTCSPSKVFGAGQLHFASIAINADGSFSATTTEAGVAFNTPAQFTYTFIGHFHGQAANGTERAAGQLREDVTFNDGTAYTCTTNTLTWSALGP